MEEDGGLASKDASPTMGSPTMASPLNSNSNSNSNSNTLNLNINKIIAKPERDVAKQPDGKFHCTQSECKDEVRAFTRKCEWNKHMDKHERPYRCPADGCENLPGFTYSGGLLRHEREVHGKHGGPRNTVNCPHPNCKRHTGKGFSRQENLNEHLRRVHTHMEGSTPPAAESAASPDDNESEKSGVKRKRRLSDEGMTSTTTTTIITGTAPEITAMALSTAVVAAAAAATTPIPAPIPDPDPTPLPMIPDETTDLHDEITRLREENEKLKAEMERQTEHSLTMMAQITQLQDALRSSLSQQGLGAPTAPMI